MPNDLPSPQQVLGQQPNKLPSPQDILGGDEKKNSSPDSQPTSQPLNNGGSGDQSGETYNPNLTGGYGLVGTNAVGGNYGAGAAPPAQLLPTPTKKDANGNIVDEQGNTHDATGLKYGTILLPKGVHEQYNEKTKQLDYVDSEGNKVDPSQLPTHLPPQPQREDTQAIDSNPIGKILAGTVLGSTNSMIEGIQQLHDSQNVVQGIAGGAKYLFGLAGLTDPAVAQFNTVINAANEVLPEKVAKWESPLSTAVKENGITDPTLKSWAELGDVFLQFATAEGIGAAVKKVRSGAGTPEEIQQVNNAIQDFSKYEPAISQMPETLTPNQKLQTAPLVLDNINLREANKDLIAKKVKAAPEFADTFDKQIKDNEDKIKNNQDKINDLLTKTEKDASKIESTTKVGEQPIGTESVGEVGGKGVEQSEQGQASAEQSSEPTEALKPADNIQIKEVIDKPVMYNGEKATLYQEGQTIVAKIEGKNREYEIGNIDEVGNHSIKDYGIEQENSVVSSDELGNITVRGKVYENKFSDPLAAINRDKDGNIVSVNLETPEGEKRTFRGNVAEDIAYQIHLKEISKDNETKQQFENFANNDESTKSAINDRADEVNAQSAADNNNAKVSRTRAKRSKPNDKVKPIDNIITHPESEFSKQGLVNTNDSDNPKIPNDILSREGRQEARKIDLRGYDKIFVSPNERTQQTVDLASKKNDVDIQTTELLKTGDVSDKEGTKESDIDEKKWLNSKDGSEFKDRMEQAYQLKQDNPDAAFVTHTKVQRALEALKTTDGKWTDETSKKFLKEPSERPEQDEKGAENERKTNISESIPKKNSNLEAGEKGRAPSKDEGNDIPPTSKSKVENDADEEGLSIKKRDLTERVQKQLTFTKGWSKTLGNAIDKLGKSSEESGNSIEKEAESQVNKWYSQYFNEDGTPKEDFNPTDEQLATIAVHLLDIDSQIKKSDFDPSNYEDAVQLDNLDKQQQKAQLLLRPDVAGRSFAFRQALFKATADGRIEMTRKQMSQLSGIKLPESEEQFNELSDKQKKFIKPLYDAYNEYRENVKGLESKSKATDEDIANKEFEKSLTKEVKKWLAENKEGDIKISKRKSVADAIRKAADKFEKFGKADLPDDTKISGVDLQKAVANAMRYIADKIEEGKLKLPDIIADAIGKYGDKDINEHLKTNIHDALIEAGIKKEQLSSAKEKAIDKLKEFAEKGEKDITPDVADSNAIRDIVKSYLGKEEPKDILNIATKEIKEILPDATKEQVRDAYLNTGEYKKENTSKLKTDIKDADAELKRIAKKEKDIEDLEKQVKKNTTKKDTKKSSYEIELEDKKAKILREKQKTYEDIEAEKKQQAERKKKTAETKLRRGEFDDTPNPIEYKQGLEQAKLELEAKLAQRKLEEATKRWQEQNKGVLERNWDRLRRFQVANLISSMVGIGKIAYSGIAKPITDTAIRGTAGRLIKPITDYLGISKATERQQLSPKAVIKSFNDSFIGMSEEAAEIKAKSIEENLNNSIQDLNNAYSKAKQIIQEYGIDSNEYKDFENGELANAKNDYRTALLNDQINFIYRFISPNPWADRYQILKHGSTDFEEAMGGYNKKYFSNEKGIVNKSLYALESFARLHSAMKDASARQALMEGYVKRMEKLSENGKEPTQAEMVGALFQSYNNDYLAGKYQEANKVSSLIRGAQEAGNKAGGWQEAVSKVTQALTPVLKIPLNIEKEGLLKYTLGTPIAAAKTILRIAKALKLNPEQEMEGLTTLEKIRKNMADMPPEQADQITEYASKGLVGLGLFTYGAYATANGSMIYGGAYEPNKSKRKYVDENGKEQTLEYGHIVIDGHDIGKTWSAILTHFPLTMPIILGNSYVSAYKDDIGNTKNPKTESKAIYDGIANMAAETWYDSPVRNLGNVAGYGQTLWNSFTSQMALKSLSEQFDKDQNGNLIDRKPTNIGQEVAMRTGLRALVPEKDKALKQIAKEKREQAKESRKERKEDNYYKVNR